MNCPLTQITIGEDVAIGASALVDTIKTINFVDTYTGAGTYILNGNHWEIVR